MIIVTARSKDHVRETAYRYPAGLTWQVDDDYLTVFNGKSEKLAQFPPGSWDSVEDKDEGEAP